MTPTVQVNLQRNPEAGCAGSAGVLRRPVGCCRVLQKSQDPWECLVSAEVVPASAGLELSKTGSCWTRLRSSAPILRAFGSWHGEFQAEADEWDDCALSRLAREFRRSRSR